MGYSPGLWWIGEYFLASLSSTWAFDFSACISFFTDWLLLSKSLNTSDFSEFRLVLTDKISPGRLEGE